ncbi:MULTISPECIES: fasciclin domain-containing protein [Sphingobacterium]|uniref:Fasciclin domain-containing protein n=2 Tax=Sphingobacterium TaxID=28453 RepID=A0ABU8I6Z6_9SPHI|nr:fasciclin domain-containing protein [Sphingobacterium sp. 1.A.4]QBR11893.1 hypothetical protein E3D81_06850 [Sphingobacterium sp. CZ-2]
MMKKLTKNLSIWGMLGILGFLGISGCAKDDYYKDGGLAKAEFDGTILEYLDSKPVLFDSVAAIIRAAEMEEFFNTEEFTFFAPSDRDIKDLIGSKDKGGLNRRLYDNKQDTIKTFTDVDPSIWQRYLYRYMFRGKNKLADYPQIDFGLLSLFGGQNYRSMAGDIFKIGVVFNDAVGSGSNLKYMGYRQLHVGLIGDPSRPDNFDPVPVSTSDIQPTNGVIHVLDYTRVSFGFDQNQVMNDIIESKR